MKLFTDQMLPALVTAMRVETGALKFGEDWPGLFIRGDNCIMFKLALEQHLDNPADPIALLTVKSLIQLLDEPIIKRELPEPLEASGESRP